MFVYCTLTGGGYSCIHDQETRLTTSQQEMLTSSRSLIPSSICPGARVSSLISLTCVIPTCVLRLINVCYRSRFIGIIAMYTSSSTRK
jgi:hypothetical protein